MNRQREATRFALDSLPDEFETFCKENRPDLVASKVFAQFGDHYRANDEKRVDWFAAWRKWVRNERSTTPRSQTAPGFSVPTAAANSMPVFVAPASDPVHHEASKERAREFVKKFGRPKASASVDTSAKG